MGSLGCPESEILLLQLKFLFPRSLFDWLKIIIDFNCSSLLEFLDLCNFRV